MRLEALSVAAFGLKLGSASMHGRSPAPKARRLLLVVAASLAVHLGLLMPWHVSAKLKQSGPTVAWMTARLLPATASHGRSVEREETIAPAEAAQTSEQRAVSTGVDARSVESNASPAHFMASSAAVSALIAASGRAATPPPAKTNPDEPTGPTTALEVVSPEALPAAPDYLGGGTLDPGPRPLQDINPVYPDRAGKQHGSVVLRLLINEQGKVDNVAVVRSSPKDYFEQAAIDAFATATFSAGRVLGLPVKSQIMIEVEFAPINRGAGVSGKSY